MSFMTLLSGHVVLIGKLTVASNNSFMYASKVRACRTSSTSKVHACRTSSDIMDYITVCSNR